MNTWYPSSGEPNTKAPIPAYYLLDWQNSIHSSANDQYNKWTWNMPKGIEDAKYCSLISLDYDATFYTNAPRMAAIRIDEMGSKNVYSSNSSPQVKPTFIVPASSANPQLNTGGRDEFMTEVDLMGPLTTLTVTFANETLVPVPVVASPTPPFRFLMLLKFWN